MDFNRYQKKAIDLVDGNVCVIATAGSGKTSVLIERINHMVEDCNIPAENILAVSFSKKACENMVERLNKRNASLENVTVKTLHALAYNIVRDAYGSKYEIWNKQWEKEKALFEICKRLKLCSNENDLPLAYLLLFINTQKINMLKPSNKLVSVDSMPYPQRDMKQVYKLYEEYKDNAGLLEFEDLVNKACDILSKNKGLLKDYMEQYKYILVDEYQDISLNQNKMLKMLNGNNNLFAVGDSLQAIYSFRGGDCEYLLNFKTEWENANVINLPINYRCSSDIVTSANKLATFTPDSRNEFYKPAIADKGNNVKPVFTEFNTIDDECNFIIQTIQQGVENGNSYNDYAILTRTNSQLQRIQNSLVRKSIGFDIVDGVSYFDLPEIKLFVSYLRLGVDINDNAAFTYCFNKPNRWLSKAFFEETSGVARGGSLYTAMFNIDRRNWRFKNGIDELYSLVNWINHKKNTRVDKIVKYIRATLSIDNYILKTSEFNAESITEKIENIDALEKMCEDFKTLKDFLEYVDESDKMSKPVMSGGGSVKLMTIHKSKGLEFPIVFVFGCADEVLPHIKNKSKDDEKRLFYVAITRAERELYLTYAKSNNGRRYAVSPFIDYLGDTISKNFLPHKG